jgi:hypothetical protein
MREGSSSVLPSFHTSIPCHLTTTHLMRHRAFLSCSKYFNLLPRFAPVNVSKSWPVTAKETNCSTLSVHVLYICEFEYKRAAVPVRQDENKKWSKGYRPSETRCCQELLLSLQYGVHCFAETFIVLLSLPCTYIFQIYICHFKLRDLILNWRYIWKVGSF